MQNGDWYSEPLDVEDLVAGGTLLFLGAIFIAISIAVINVMKKQDKDIVGYRFLVSGGITDILLLFNYGVWPGLTILHKSEIVTPAMRHWVQLYLDWVWFSMVWHYSVVSWSRWRAIRAPHAFRTQRRMTSYLICSGCFVLSFIQVMATHFQPWYVTFYYEPSSYGMLAEDFNLYLKGGQSAMFLAFHIAAVLPPIVFYSWSVALLLKRKRSNIISNTHSLTATQNVESRLLLPCLINMVVFVIGQVVITIGTGEGKWAGFTVMLVFCTNSALNPMLLLCCSITIRKQLLVSFGLRKNSVIEKYKETSTIYRRSPPLLRKAYTGCESPTSSGVCSEEPSTHV